MDTPTVEETSEGNLKRSSTVLRMVNRDSATKCSDNATSHVPIDGNHSTMVKFNSRFSPGYVCIIERLNQSLNDTARAREHKLVKEQEVIEQRHN
ncbi:Similar to Pc13g00660 [Penicillium chrysogenum Wisconsin 54-1255]; acc. no. XP_002558513 [Pyronema omphalodes CBS 100304]|uniref:Similar to Pc13g00660 [Penicillium chrysogenum Wisconsin 54-1255] acc. no. XP_002558513 n=1 Tax=Pyronema omphalodes (strain CBS 100304) TaxID=1076935 RepID=U4L708_PYROM|nr:Similar to Pc13g00660 [Penicillium chrysogenum Wisconsin 54-1255]; acc. no. XP_002558513 [Pyronema omphalodes CBS 100304]